MEIQHDCYASYAFWLAEISKKKFRSESKMDAKAEQSFSMAWLSFIYDEFV